MINKEMLKGFVIGALSTMVISSAVFAAPIQKNITAAYSNIKIYVDGILIQPKDAASNTVEPFVSGGTTYLPVRAVGEAFGKDVKWDGSTNSVYIGKLPEQKSADVLVKNGEVVVSNAEEFVKAIGSDRKIILKPGTYDISTVANKVSNDNVTWQGVYDGYRMEISDIKNLTIQGDGNKPVDILVEPRNADVFHLVSCKNITLKNIRAGHTTTTTKEECRAGVLYIQDSEKISIIDSILFGCGSEGISAFNVTNLNMEDSVIEKCNAQVMTLYGGKDFTFNNCKFRECCNYIMFSFGDLKNVVFNGCEIRDNVSGEYPLIGFENIIDPHNNNSQDVKFLNTKFINNKTKNFCDSTLDTKGSIFEGNSFDKK